MGPYLERRVESFLNQIMSQLTLFTIRLCNVTIKSIVLMKVLLASQYSCALDEAG